eukprot:5930667-Karenia_brevis.AAC.1
MRARVFIARCWEQAHHIHGIFGGPGRGAQRASWISALASEGASLKKFDHVQIFMDLVQAFQTIPHSLLAAAAQAKGYDLAILRLSLAAYRLQRSIGIDGVYSHTVCATRGITAGS